VLTQRGLSPFSRKGQIYSPLADSLQRVDAVETVPSVKPPVHWAMKAPLLRAATWNPGPEPSAQNTSQLVQHNRL